MGSIEAGLAIRDVAHDAHVVDLVGGSCWAGGVAEELVIGITDNTLTAVGCTDTEGALASTGHTVLWSSRGGVVSAGRTNLSTLVIPTTAQVAGKHVVGAD